MHRSRAHRRSTSGPAAVGGCWRRGLPDDPEFRSALLAYVEWGTRLALHNSQPGADVVAEAPVPRWGRGEAPPYRG